LGYTHYTHYLHYTYYINYIHYTDYVYYFQVCQDLGIADHVWQDKRTAIAQSVDALGDQFRPAMRSGWLSYIRRNYPEDAADGAGPAVGEEMLVLPG
jgi:hypothetical protein